MGKMIKGKDISWHFYNVPEYREAVARCLIDMLKLIETKKIVDHIGKIILEKFMKNPFDFDVNKYVQDNKLDVIFYGGVLEKFCKEAIKENPQAVEDYKKGETRALNFIIGVVMKKTKGKATPKEINEILLGKLSK